MNGVPVTEPVLANVLAKISQARRPLLILGQGVRLSGAAPLVERLVRGLGIPVQTTWNGMDLIGYDHSLYFGRANLFGTRYANMIIQNADFILVIGARLGMQHTGYNIEAFARAAEIAMVDLDPAEMNKPGLKVTLQIRSDAKAFIQALCERIGSGKAVSCPLDWMAYCAKIKQKYPRHKRLLEIEHDRYVDPFYFVGALTELLPADAVIPYGSSGMPHTVFGGNYDLRSGQRAFCFKGLAAMGYGLPSSVGAAFAAPGKTVFTLIGEGGLQLNIQDLQTIRHFHLPVKIVVFNNGGYHSIHMTQGNFFAKHFVASGPESDVTFPPLEGVAKLYGFRYHKLERNTEVGLIFSQFAADSAPAFLEVMIDPEKSLDPKLASYQKPDGTMESRPLEDMSPLLSREELQSDMLIPLVT
jgi:acetolactate synthase-1/2/3 large subunit